MSDDDMKLETADRLECGCLLFTTEDGIFGMNPCSPTCDVYAYAIEESRKQGKPITTLDMTKTHRFKGGKCPYCEAPNDGANGDDPRKRPKPGDLSICVYCLSCAFFTEGGMRKPTPEEQTQIDNDAHVQATIKSARFVFASQRESRRRKGGDVSE